VKSLALAMIGKKNALTALIAEEFEESAIVQLWNW
jgi:hypothetical protein